MIKILGFSVEDLGSILTSPLVFGKNAAAEYLEYRTRHPENEQSFREMCANINEAIASGKECDFNVREHRDSHGWGRFTTTATRPVSSGTATVAGEPCLTRSVMRLRGVR